MHSGLCVKCPHCGAELTIPGKRSADSDAAKTVHDWRFDVAAPRRRHPPTELTAIRETLQSNIEGGAVTITRFMADQKMEGGVNLDSPADTSASQIRTDEKPQPLG